MEKKHAAGHDRYLFITYLLDARWTVIGCAGVLRVLLAARPALSGLKSGCDRVHVGTLVHFGGAEEHRVFEFRIEAA